MKNNGNENKDDNTIIGTAFTSPNKNPIGAKNKSDEVDKSTSYEGETIHQV